MLRRLILAVGLAAFSVSASADPALTPAWSNMRRAPSAHSGVVQSVPANAQIDVQSCAGEWCYGSWRNLFGYLPAFAVGGSGGGPPPVVSYAPPPVVVAAPPIVVGTTWGWGHPYCWGRLWLRLASVVTAALCHSRAPDPI
jgi:hypothetical protein